MLKNKKSNIVDKVAGAIYGFAIGDAMGATTEFMTKDQIECIHGTVDNIIGGGWLSLDPGQVTDDTEMMLCVAEGYQAHIINGTKFIDEVSNRFIDWYESGPIDCGSACIRGIQRMIDGQGIRFDRDALGNGALMRALPLALVDCLNLNLAQADLTHCNAVQHSFVKAYHNMIVRQVYGSGYGSEIEWPHGATCNDVGKPSGHVANTLYHAVMNNIVAYDFEQVIVRSVNNGGDADTIAAIAGGLAGAKYGWHNIPTRWIDQLDFGVKSRLDMTVDFLVDCCLKRHIGV